MCAVLRKANPQADLLAEARISQFRNDGASWHTNRINEPTDALSVLTQTLDNGRVLLANGVLSVTIEPTVQSRRCLTRSMAVNWFRPAPDWANTNC